MDREIGDIVKVKGVKGDVRLHAEAANGDGWWGWWSGHHFIPVNEERIKKPKRKKGAK